MKNYKLFLVIMVICMGIPGMVIAKDTCSQENIKIESIELKDKTDIVEEKSPASIENKKIHLGLKMYEVGDYAEYALKVKNSSEDAFYFDEKSLNIDSDYFDYSLKYEGNSNKIEPLEDKTIYLRVELKKEIEKEKYYNGSYINTKLVNLNISDNKESIITNPLTKNNKLLLIVISIIIISTLYFIKNKKHSNIPLFLLGVLLILPFTTYALCKVNLEIEPNIEVVKVKPNPCTYDGELVQGAEYVNGQYTYTYKPTDKTCNNTWSGGRWIENCVTNEYGDGWGVILTDKESTEPVTTKLCTSINDKPIVYMKNTFALTKATSIDLSSFDTSNVVSMYEMFMGSSRDKNNFKELDLSSFDTSKVTDMDYMFQYLTLDYIDLTTFEVSNVETIRGIFYGANLKNALLEGVDFRNLKDAYSAFYSANIENLNLRNIKTEKLETTNMMFMLAKIKNTIDMSSFAKTNLKDMFEMFMLFEGEEVILNGMDTSNVTDMDYLFQDAKVKKIDLRNIDTSSVKTMKEAFARTEADEILFPNKFSFDENASLSRMFNSTKTPKIDISGMDTSNVSDMNNMFSYTTTKEIVLSSKFTNNGINTVYGMNSMFYRVNIKYLDLTSFDINKIPSGATILNDVNIDTIYVKTEEDAEWYRNNGTYNPNNYNYVVKK